MSSKQISVEQHQIAQKKPLRQIKTARLYNQHSKKSHQRMKSGTCDYKSPKKKLSEIHLNLLQLEQKFTHFEKTLKNINKNAQKKPEVNQQINLQQEEHSQRKKIMSNQQNKIINAKRNVNIQKCKAVKSQNKKQRISINGKIYQCKNIPSSYFENIDLLFQNQIKRKQRLSRKKPKQTKNIKSIEPTLALQKNQTDKQKTNKYRKVSRKIIYNSQKQSQKKQQQKCINLLNLENCSNEKGEISNEQNELFSPSRTRQLKECKRMMSNTCRTYRYCQCCENSSEHSVSPSPEKIKSNLGFLTNRKSRFTRTTEQLFQKKYLIKHTHLQEVNQLQMVNDQNLQQLSHQKFTQTQPNTSNLFQEIQRQDSAKTKKNKFPNSQQKLLKNYLPMKSKQLFHINGVKFKSNKQNQQLNSKLRLSQQKQNIQNKKDKHFKIKMLNKKSSRIQKQRLRQMQQVCEQQYKNEQDIKTLKINSQQQFQSQSDSQIYHKIQNTNQENFEIVIRSKFNQNIEASQQFELPKKQISKHGHRRSQTMENLDNAQSEAPRLQSRRVQSSMFKKRSNCNKQKDKQIKEKSNRVTQQNNIIFMQNVHSKEKEDKSLNQGHLKKQKISKDVKIKKNLVVKDAKNQNKSQLNKQIMAKQVQDKNHNAQNNKQTKQNNINRNIHKNRNISNHESDNKLNTHYSVNMNNAKYQIKNEKQENVQLNKQTKQKKQNNEYYDQNLHANLNESEEKKKIKQSENIIKNSQQFLVKQQQQQQQNESKKQVKMCIYVSKIEQANGENNKLQKQYDNIQFGKHSKSEDSKKQQKDSTNVNKCNSQNIQQSNILKQQANGSISCPINNSKGKIQNNKNKQADKNYCDDEEEIQSKQESQNKNQKSGGEDKTENQEKVQQKQKQQQQNQQQQQQQQKQQQQQQYLELQQDEQKYNINVKILEHYRQEQKAQSDNQQILHSQDKQKYQKHNQTETYLKQQQEKQELHKVIEGQINNIIQYITDNIQHSINDTNINDMLISFKKCNNYAKFTKQQEPTKNMINYNQNCKITNNEQNSKTNEQLGQIKNQNTNKKEQKLIYQNEQQQILINNTNKYKYENENKAMDMKLSNSGNLKNTSKQETINSEQKSSEAKNIQVRSIIQTNNINNQHINNNNNIDSIASVDFPENQKLMNAQYKLQECCDFNNKKSSSQKEQDNKNDANLKINSQQSQVSNKLQTQIKYKQQTIINKQQTSQYENDNKNYEQKHIKNQQNNYYSKYSMSQNKQNKAHLQHKRECSLLSQNMAISPIGSLHLLSDGSAASKQPSLDHIFKHVETEGYLYPESGIAQNINMKSMKRKSSNVSAFEQPYSPIQQLSLLSQSNSNVSKSNNKNNENNENNEKYIIGYTSSQFVINNANQNTSHFLSQCTERECQNWQFPQNQTHTPKIPQAFSKLQQQSQDIKQQNNYIQQSNALKKKRVVKIAQQPITELTQIKQQIKNKQQQPDKEVVDIGVQCLDKIQLLLNDTDYVEDIISIEQRNNQCIKNANQNHQTTHEPYKNEGQQQNNNFNFIHSNINNKINNSKYMANANNSMKNTVISIDNENAIVIGEKANQNNNTQQQKQQELGKEKQKFKQQQQKQSTINTIVQEKCQNANSIKQTTMLSLNQNNKKQVIFNQCHHLIKQINNVNQINSSITEMSGINTVNNFNKINKLKMCSNIVSLKQKSKHITNAFSLLICNFENNGNITQNSKNIHKMKVLQKIQEDLKQKIKKQQQNTKSTQNAQNNKIQIEPNNILLNAQFGSIQIDNSIDNGQLQCVNLQNSMADIVKYTKLNKQQIKLPYSIKIKQICINQQILNANYLIKQIYKSANCQPEQFINRLFTPHKKQAWICNQDFKLYKFNSNENKYTKQQYFLSLFMKLYQNNAKKTNNIQTLLYAMTGCPILKLQANKWSKIKNIKKHKNIFGFAIENSSQTNNIQRIMATQQIKQNEKIFKIVKLKKSNGKCINVRWEKLIKNYETSFLIALNPNYFIRFFQISNSETNHSFLIDLIYAQNKNELSKNQKMHCAFNVQPYNCDKSLVTVYEQSEQNKYVNIGTGDPSFISMQLKPRNHLLVFQNCRKSKINLCCSRYVEMKNGRWAENMEEALTYRGEELIKCSEIL